MKHHLRLDTSSLKGGKFVMNRDWLEGKQNFSLQSKGNKLPEFCFTRKDGSRHSISLKAENLRWIEIGLRENKILACTGVKAIRP